MHTSQLSICTQCASLSTLYDQVGCSIFQLIRNKWTNKSYGTALFFDESLLRDLSRYKKIIERKVINSNYLNFPASKIASLLATRMYKPVGCPECDCVDYAIFIETHADETTTTSTSSTTSPLIPPPASTSTTTLTPFTSSTTTTLPGPTMPSAECAEPVSFAGGESYPSVFEVVLGSGTGTVTLDYNMFNIPDKIIVKFEGVDVIDTGYRGSTSYQAALDSNLTTRGFPTESITSPGTGTATFNKNTATTSAFVYVFGPLPNTAWTLTLSCPE